MEMLVNTADILIRQVREGDFSRYEYVVVSRVDLQTMHTSRDVRVGDNVSKDFRYLVGLLRTLESRYRRCVVEDFLSAWFEFLRAQAKTAEIRLREICCCNLKKQLIR
jgi:hypothetical protein